MAVVVVAGLLGRSLPGLVGDIVGGLLYAVLLYLLLALLAPRSRTATLVMAAAVLGVTVELVQLTGLPARVGDLWDTSPYQTDFPVESISTQAFIRNMGDLIEALEG